MSDGYGISQFMLAVAEIARGATSPSILPVWERHIFTSQNPPLLTYPLPEYNITVSDSSYDKDMVSQSFFFGPTEISALSDYFNHVQDLHRYSSFDMISACVLRCRVVALQLHPEEEMGIVRTVNLRGKFKGFVPDGYYGNAIANSLWSSTAKDILSNLLRVVRNANDRVTKEYIQNEMHLFVTNDRKPRLPVSVKYFLESNLRYLGFEDVDFGWGKALYVGSAVCSHSSGLYTPFKDGLLLPLSLPRQAMQRFIKEMDFMLKRQPVAGDDNVLKSKI